jgi:hypothetical protein
MIMEKDTEFKQKYLENLLNDLRNKVTTNEIKYFHVNTIENLITHFQFIKTENDKIWVYESLVDYFEHCSHFYHSIDRETSQNIFDTYIDKITNYYHSNLGFVLLINRAVVYGVYLVAVLICSIYFKWYILVTVISLILYQIIRTYNKFKSKQVYSLFW